MRKLCITEKPAELSADEIICRFARASAVLLRIADRIGKEAAQKIEDSGAAEAKRG